MVFGYSMKAFLSKIHCKMSIFKSTIRTFSLKEWCCIQNHSIRHELVELAVKARPDECGKKVIRLSGSLAHEKEQLVLSCLG